MIGTITHIQRLSIHDGPGIRSTIFLKACNFRCAWCHNPETFIRKPELEWLSDKCINCQACVLMCESGALSVNEEQLSFQKKLCTSCFHCVQVCFPEALNKVGRELTAEDIYKEVEPDFPYFEESKGGITISGGEPMLQDDFTVEILRLFHKSGIHTAMETNLSLPWTDFEKALPFLNYVMADLKMMDEALHKQWTKSGNKQVLENIRKLDSAGIPYMLRTPVVPGVNDNKESIIQIQQFVSSLQNIESHQLLPFHALADTKYKNLGIKNQMEGIQDLSADKLEQLNKIKKKLLVDERIINGRDGKI